MAEQWPFKPLVEGSIPSTLITPYLGIIPESPLSVAVVCEIATFFYLVALIVDGK